MNGYQIEARRHAREVVGDLRWQDMTVPPLYARMAGEFEDLVRSGDYAAWVAAHQHPVLAGGRSRAGRVLAWSRPSRNEHAPTARHVRPAAGHAARDLLSNPGR